MYNGIKNAIECTNCGHLNDDKGDYCISCGLKLARISKKIKKSNKKFKFSLKKIYSINDPLKITPIKLNYEAKDHKSSISWLDIKDKVDFSLYKPQKICELEIKDFKTSRGNIYYVIKNVNLMTYMRLDENDIYIYELMDGTRTVQDLVMEYLSKFGSLSMDRIISLIKQLRSQNFLQDSPLALNEELYNKTVRKTPQQISTDILKSFITKKFTINNLHNIVNFLYSSFFKIFFNKPMFILYIIISITGMGLFAYLSINNEFSIVAHKGSLDIGLTIFLLVQIFVVSVHEGAHAFMTKYYKRDIRSGGMMFFYGSLAFFVDTMDIWMENKKARIMVSWAGPFSGVIIASICSILMFLYPENPYNPVLYKAAFLGMLFLVMNLNPLLELDGYYMLMDWLEIPMLRSKSLAFIKNEFFSSLLKHRKFSREEWIYIIYGLTASVFTAVFTVFIIYMLQSRAWSILQKLFSGKSSISIFSVILLIIVIFLCLAVVVKVIGLVQSVLLFIKRKAIFRHSIKYFIFLLFSLIVLGLLPSYLKIENNALYFSCLTELLWLVGLIFSIKLVKKYESSYQRKVFFFLTIFCSFGAVVGLSEILSLLSSDLLTHYLSNNQIITQCASLLLSVIYFVYSFSLFNMTELNHTTYIEKILMLVLIIISFLIVLLVRYTLPNDTSLVESIIFISPIFLGIISITLTIPTLYSYFETNFKFSYLSMTIGYLTLLVIHFMWVVDDISYEHRILLDYWGIGAIIISILVHNHTLDNHKLIVRYEAKVSGYKALNDKQRLRSSFIKIWQVILFSLKYVNGTRVTQILQDKINSISATKNYGIALLSDNVGDRISENVSILELSSIYQSVFSFGIKYISEISGKQFVQEVLEMGYNQLFWAEREVIDNYIFKGGGVGVLIDKEFLTTKKNYAQLLKELPIFQGLENDEIRMILSRAAFQSYEPDEIIVKQGEPPTYFYILVAGEIDIIKKDSGSLPKLVDHLGPGAYFGELAILRNTVRAATCKAVTNVEVMAFNKEDFNDFIAKYLRISNLIEENYDLHLLLHQMPLFSELLPYQLEQVIKKLKHQEYPPLTTIFSQGEIGDCFYIVKKGELDISVEMNGKESVVAKLSKGEYFGEIALMNRSPRTSTVKTVTKSTLLALALEDFEKIMEEMKITASELEKMKSRRLLDLTGKSELQKSA